MRHKELILGQKALFKAGSPSNQPTGGSEKTNQPESKEAVNALTKEKLKGLKAKVEQTHIKFSNKESKEYDQSIYRGRTLVEANRTENLREGNNFKSVRKASKGEKLVLTGEFKVLEYKPNGQERVYWETLTRSGDKLYILGESITPLKTGPQNKETVKEMTANGMSLVQANYIDQVRPKASSTTEKESVKPEEIKARPEEKTEQATEATETPIQRMSRLRSGLMKHEQGQLKYDFENPDTLKDLLKGDRINDIQRTKIENSMNNLGLSFSEISRISSENGNRLPLEALIKATPLENEAEYKDLEKEFFLSETGSELNKEIQKLQKSDKPEDKILLSQKQEELKAKQKEYAQKNYQKQLEYYEKNSQSKNILRGYLLKTEEVAQNPSEDSQKEFETRYKKLQSILELSNTLQNLEVKKSGLINNDKIENVTVSSASATKLEDYADNMHTLIGLNNEQLKRVKDNLNESLFGTDEKNLQLLATIMLATDKDLDQLSNEGVIKREGENINLNLDTLGAHELNKLIIGLAYSESQSSGFLDSAFDTDNLTESLSTLQNSKMFNTAKVKMYEYEIKEQGANDINKASYLHLNHIFDKNQTGGTISQNDRLYTRTMEDNLGGSGATFDRGSIINRYSSELTKYQNLLQEVEVNGEVNPQKLVNKFNQLIKLGGLGVDFNEELPQKMRDSLKEQAKNARPLTVEDLKSPLSDQMINLIRYGVVYEELRNDFLKSSDRSPNKLIEKAGFSETDPQATYSALSTALQYIENGNLAVGSDTDSVELGNGWELKGAGALGVYVLKNPKVSTAASLTITKDLDKNNKFYISTGAGVGFGPDTFNAGVNAEVGLSSKSSNTMTAEIAAGGGLTLAGINVYVRGGLKENRILKDKNDRMATGLENISEKKLSKEEITYLKNLANKPNLSPEDINNAAQYFPGLEEAIAIDPVLRSLPKDQLEVFKSNYIQTLLRQLDNMTTEEAEGVNWNAAIAVGALITPAGPIPYIMPMVGFEWGGDTKVMKLYDNNNQLTEAQLRDQLRKSLKEMPKGTSLQIVSESGYAANINGKEVIVKGANEVVRNLEISNPVDKLNALRGTTGVEFSKLNDSFLSAKIDDYKKVTNGINTAAATRVNVYVDPALEGTFKLGHMDNAGEVGIKMLQGQIPDNLVILRESISTPSTSGGATTEVKISLTTRENLLTGSEIENSSSLYDYVSLDKYGRPELNRDENNLNFNELNVDKTVSFDRNFTQTEAKLLAEYSDGLISRSTTTLERNTHTPTAQLDALVDKLAGEKGLLEKLAVYTTQRIESGQEMDLQKAYETIEAQAKELGYNRLSKEDYLYIFGNLLPDTFRPINSLKPEKRKEAINKLATQYVEEYVRNLTKNNLKPNGERFTEAETQIIIKNLSKHSRVKDAFRASLEQSPVTLESANQAGLTGYEIYTTAHKGKLKGLRRSQITPAFDAKMVKGSLTKFNSSTIENPQERLIVNQFLQSMGEQVPVLNSNEFTRENLSNTEFQERIKQVLNSKTALQLMSTTPFSSNGEKVSLLGAMYGPEALMHIENFYERMDQLGKAPVGRLLVEGPARDSMIRLINDIQKINEAQGTLKMETYKGDPLEINIKEESGVILIGKCANPTYVYQRRLGAKLQVSETSPAAARAKASKIYNLGDARRENMNRIGFGTKLSLVPEPTTPTPKKPNTPRPPDTPDLPPDTPPETPPQTPGKTNTTRGADSGDESFTNF